MRWAYDVDLYYTWNNSIKLMETVIKGGDEAARPMTTYMVYLPTVIRLINTNIPAPVYLAVLRLPSTRKHTRICNAETFVESDQLSNSFRAMLSQLILIQASCVWIRIRLI